MILYHGSNIAIDVIDLSKCRPNKDFGQGFYLTDIKEQAVKMSQRTARIYGGNPVVSAFSFDETIFTNGELIVKEFDSPTEEWARFVIANRDRKRTFVEEDNNKDCRYDVVIGPVANDDIALLFRQFEDELIDIDTLVEGMKYKKLTRQYSFHTERAVALLKKEGA